MAESVQFDEGPATSCSDAKRKLKFLEEHSSSLNRIRGTHLTPFTLPSNRSKLFQEFKNVEVVRKLLGHRSVMATSSYLDMEDADATELARSVEI